MKNNQMRLCLALLGLVFAAVACGSGSGTEERSTSPSDGVALDTSSSDDVVTDAVVTDDDAVTPTSPPEDSGVSEPPESISDLLGMPDVNASDDEEQALLVEAQLGREDSVVRCMNQQGFDYFPADASQMGFESPGVDGLAYNTRGYVARFGFGITTQAYSAVSVGAGLVGNPDLDRPPVRTVDPNQEYYESLSDSARIAYDEALWGPPRDPASFDPDTATEAELADWQASFALSAQGCQGLAYAEEVDEELLATFGDAVQEDIYNAALADPRMVAAEAEANECIARAGFGFDITTSSSEQLKQELVADLAEVEALLGPTAFDNLTNEEIAALSIDELDALLYEPRVFSDEAKALLGELQTNEIQLALVVFDCGGWYSTQDELYRELVREYEAEFFAENAGVVAGTNEDG